MGTSYLKSLKPLISPQKERRNVPKISTVLPEELLNDKSLALFSMHQRLSGHSFCGKYGEMCKYNAHTNMFFFSDSM